MKIRSAKNKGLGFQKEIQQQLLQTFPELQPEDIKTAVASQPGQDLKLSPAARRLIPYSFQCKRSESLNIYRAIEQSKSNCKNYCPAVVFRKNRMEP